MNVQIPSDFVPFVQRLQQNQESLRRAVQMGMGELDAGMGIDGEEIFLHLDQLITEKERTRSNSP